MPIVSYGRHARLPPVWASLLCLAAAGTPADLAVPPATDGGSPAMGSADVALMAVPMVLRYNNDLTNIGGCISPFNPSGTASAVNLTAQLAGSVAETAVLRADSVSLARVTHATASHVSRVGVYCSRATL